MCIENVDLKPIVTEGVGYKLVQTDGKNYYSWDYIPSVEIKFKYQFKKDKWLVDPNPGTSRDDGFHIYIDKNIPSIFRPDKYLCHDGMHQVIIKIAYQKVIATGYSNGNRCAVAKEIKFIEEVNA